MTKQHRELVEQLRLRFRALHLKFEQIKMYAEEMAALAREAAGPHGVILDAESLAAIRPATEGEVRESLAAARDGDPVGSITIDGREVFAVPSAFLREKVDHARS